jgi:hypothetical protein
MAKTKISEFSATSADNTDITNINIAEGCSPANVNNAIRSLMSLLKNQQDGSSGDPFTVAGTLVASGQAVSSGTLNVTGAFQLDGTAGASGQALVSAGGANTPTWSTLGTMAAQNSTTVAITGGTITGITDLAVADGGTGASTLSANAVLLGNGTSALQTVAPSTSGNVLTSNGTTWTSSAPASTSTGAGTLTASGQTFTITTGSQGKCLINLSASYNATFGSWGTCVANLVIGGTTVATDSAITIEYASRVSGDHAIIAYQYSGSANASVTVTFTTTFPGTFNKAFYSFIGS